MTLHELPDRDFGDKPWRGTVFVEINHRTIYAEYHPERAACRPRTQRGVARGHQKPFVQHHEVLRVGKHLKIADTGLGYEIKQGGIETEV